MSALQAVAYRNIEVMLFHTCNYNCAYCGFVTGGTVDYVADLEPFRDRSYCDKVIGFFEKYSDDRTKWNLLLSGGEPFLTPNLPYLSGTLIERGHKIRYNTNLSVPIERDDDWLKANPPSGVDVIMASLHPESLVKRDAIFKRMETLKNLGYRIIARAVAHPLLIDQLEELDEASAQIGISFNAIPMFSPRYPSAYTPEEREKIAARAKSFGHLIQLNGGLDTTGRLCHAGSQLFALGLGRTGKGNLYRCVSCHDTAYMGNIFEGKEIKFLSRPVLCCQKTKHCTCSFHFESDAVIGAEDGANYEALKNGTATPVAGERFEEFVRANGLKFKNATQAPQGTDIGEKLLVYSTDAVLDHTIGKDRQTVDEITTRNARRLKPYKPGVEITVAPECVEVAALAEAGGGVVFSMPVERVPSSVTFKGRVFKGNATIAIYSGNHAHLWHSVPRSKGRQAVTEVFTPTEDVVTIYVYSDEPVRFEIEKIGIVQPPPARVGGWPGFGRMAQAARRARRRMSKQLLGTALR